MEIEGVFFNTTDYELQKEKLGEGSFGTVYIAKNIVDNIHSKDGFNGHQQMLFLRESLKLNKLSHPSILKFKGVNFQSFTNPNLLQPVIITEYLSHGSLKDNLNKEKRSLADSNLSYFFKKYKKQKARIKKKKFYSPFNTTY